MGYGQNIKCVLIVAELDVTKTLVVFIRFNKINFAYTDGLDIMLQKHNDIPT